ncbi:hypothetical protein [Paenibacillus sp. AD87]|uniref:hypothetical protein n=1 Tax=Paenibacillus sp. AD87 TaxID=1528787 RepID=UPI000A461CC0|nr:hypothetical protein [Paenibacillus sp. AD87]
MVCLQQAKNGLIEILAQIMLLVLAHFHGERAALSCTLLCGRKTDNSLASRKRLAQGTMSQYAKHWKT